MRSFTISKQKVLLNRLSFEHISDHPCRYSHKAYRIKTVRRLLFSENACRNLTRILSDIAQRYRNIELLCRIYHVPKERLRVLHSLSQVTLSEDLRCILQCRVPSDAQLYACQTLKIEALLLFQSAVIPIRRKLMLRDIADEFVSIANDLEAVTALALWQKTIQIKN